MGHVWIDFQENYDPLLILMRTINPDYEDVKLNSLHIEKKWVNLISTDGISTNKSRNAKLSIRTKQESDYEYLMRYSVLSGHLIDVYDPDCWGVGVKF